MIDLKQLALCSLLGALVAVVMMIGIDIVTDVTDPTRCPAGSTLIQGKCLMVAEAAR